MRFSTCICFLWFVGVSPTKHLSFTKTLSKLPFPRSASGAVYDGDDSIYVFGGVYAHLRETDEVLKYSISTDQIQVVANLPRTAGFLHNSVSINSRGKIHAFPSGNVFEFDPLTNETKTLPFMNVWMSPFVKISKDIVLFLFHERSSYPLSVVQIDLRTMNATVLFRHIRKDIRLTAAAFDKRNGAVYCPGYDMSNNYSGIVAKFDINTNKFSVIAADLPGYLDPSGAVWKSGKMYVVGGSYSAQEDEGVAVFDPADLSYKFIPVEGINRTVETPVYQGLAYVEKLNRIYVFGGRGSEGTTRFDSVGYFKFGRFNAITLKIDESSTLCSGMPDGFYPKPGSPTKYFNCMNEEIEEHECPASFVFDPELLTCQ